ncbi:ATP-dependent Clp protease adaptor protein ClpS [hydrothermal vent metagenome]|uniref:ATP-dependent Clp protease adaptor protein ClpS n=1 Tax=hydrothermal vent metagenome TaxID=652676 RepID=A0A1W1CTQ2_9ZZZZ
MNKVIKKTKKSKIPIPKKFEVILLNDDYTTMDFVIEVLMTFFNKNHNIATEIMLKIHIEGQAVCGVYPFDIAQTKVEQVISYARKNEQPLLCIIN